MKRMDKYIYRIIIPIFCMLILSGCGISPYRPEVGFMFVGFGGHTDFKRNNENYGVGYSSGHAAFKSKEKVRDFAMRRACELALEKDFKGFDIVEEHGDEHGWWLEISLTNESKENTIDAEQMCSTILEKYK